MDDIALTTIWAMIALVAIVPFTVYGFFSVQKEYKISLPYKAIIKYSLVTLLASIIVFYLLENTVSYPPSIFEFIPQLIPIMILGALIYFGLTYVIDESTRELFKLIIKEIKK